jgi:hypothetical protein
MTEQKTLVEKIRGLLRRKIEPFNAIIEGTFHDEWNRSHYKLARLPIPDDCALINDKQYKFGLYGRGANGGLLDFVRAENPQGSELTLNMPLAFYPGLSTYRGPVLERPRLIAMRDSRVYVSNDLLGWRDEGVGTLSVDDKVTATFGTPTGKKVQNVCVQWIPQILKSIDFMFGNEEIMKCWNESA